MKLIKGEALAEMTNIPDKSIDLILTDPPYGTTACKWDAVIPLDKMWIQLNRIIKDNGVIVLFGNQPFTTVLISSNMDMFKYTWVWDKIAGSNFFNLKYMPFKTHEDIIVFSKNGKITFNPIRVSRSKESLKRDPIGSTAIRNRNSHTVKHYNTYICGSAGLNKDGLKHPIDIITFSNTEKGRYDFKHPTKKPVKLMEYLVKTYSNEKETVLDFTMGSGTTGVACKQLNRDFIGIELDEKYFDIAEDRINKAVRQFELFIPEKENTEIYQPELLGVM